MQESATREAAELLWKTWQAGTRLDALPSRIRPATVEEGFAVQLAVAEAAGDARFGWKIAATSTAGQAHIGVDGPLPGTLLASRVRTSPTEFSLRDNVMHVAEAEFAFRLGRALPPRSAPYAREEVLDAVAALHIAVEVPDSRYRDFVHVGAAQLIADNACASWFALGPAAVRDWQLHDLAAHPVVARVNGAVAAEGRGANVLGDPRIALTWLANTLSRLGAGLAAGEVVTTGTCVTPVTVAAGDLFEADFGVFGRAAVRFTA